MTVPSVVVVDDSSFFRYQLASRLSRRGFAVVASLASGEEALGEIPRLNPDVVLMDVIMPGIDGLETVRQLRRHWSGRIILMSSHTARGVRATWAALEAGADDFLPKPNLGQSLEVMVDALSERLQEMTRRVRADSVESSEEPASVRVRGFRAIVVGASTGGPRALSQLFSQLGGIRPPTPKLLVVQHMPAGFTTSFAARLEEVSHARVVEVPPDGRHLAWPNVRVVVAAGGFHLRLDAEGCWAEPGERVHGVIPSVDVTLRDAASVFGSDLGVVILTGMGEDGAAGALYCRQQGATVIAESKQSALIWGMPKAAVECGAAEVQWSLEEIGRWLKEVMAHGGVA
ncbi:MAG: response regulator [Firmicutes bacterium]|nr:response regulator [Bacillota bacterium]